MKCTKPFAKKGIRFGCGQCMPCRIDRARLWTARIILESRLHDDNCFVTLTYDPEHYPPDGSLRKREVQLFLKKLRRRYPARTIRFFAVGEYGDDTQRAHYHLCLFGIPMADEDTISECWDKGFIKVDELNAATAGYVSQYVIKKWTNPDDLHVRRLLKGRAPEFATMSLKPGIGAGAAKIVAGAIAGKSVDIPTRLRVDGVLRPFGRYIKKAIIKEFPNAEALEKYEKETWLLSVHEELKADIADAKAAGKTLEDWRKEKKKQRFLNLVGRQKLFKSKRTL